MKKSSLGCSFSLIEIGILLLFSVVYVPFANSVSDYGYTGADAIFLVAVTRNIQLATNFIAFIIAFAACFFSFFASNKSAKKDFHRKEVAMYFLFAAILAFLAGLAYLVPNICYYCAWECLFNFAGIWVGIILLIEAFFLLIPTIFMKRNGVLEEDETMSS